MNEYNTYIVESIPTGMESLESTTEVRYTKDVLIDLTNKAKKSIDLTTMYWSLKPNSKRSDEAGFTEAQLLEMGIVYGKNLFNAIKNAAKRGVKIRILQDSGFDEDEKEQEPDEKNKQQEWTELADYNEYVEVRHINMSDWYDGGVMHQKICIFDKKDVYLGSANMDWRSLTQVKELGIVLENQSEFAQDVARYFEGWWHIANIKPVTTTEVYDPVNCFIRKVPAWSLLVSSEKRIPSPLNSEKYSTYYNMESPMKIVINGQKAEAFITGCPNEFCGPGRTYDIDSLVHTICEAKQSVCISIMEIAPISLYRGEVNKSTGKQQFGGNIATTAWWPVLFNALMHVVITNGVHVRLLVSKWEHTHPAVIPFLKSLREMASAIETDFSTCSGSLEIRFFCVPGWHSTVNTAVPKRLYPGHTRVNHAKYIVTDHRLNISTSNFTWDYFACTAGTSFNTTHPGLVEILQKIFDRDWDSEYVYPF